MNVPYDYGHEDDIIVNVSNSECVCVSVIKNKSCVKVGVCMSVLSFQAMCENCVTAIFQTAPHLLLESIGAPEYQWELLSVMPPPRGSAKNG